MTALLVALFGALCWGLAPVFGKIGLQQIDPVTGLAGRTLIAGGVVLIWLLTAGRVPALESIPAKAWLLLAAEGLLATLIGDLAYYAALKHGQAGEVTVVFAASPLVTLWVSHRWLAEALTWQKAIGALFVAVGVVLIGLPAMRAKLM